MSYDDYDAEGDLDVEQGIDLEYDGRTRLDKTIDRIGMGDYQWTLLSLCGFGWLADNMWIQATAIILPRVQQHYSVPDSYIGVLSSSMFAGMMLGAVGWGTCSDVLGRSAAFNATLFFTSVFGMLAPFASSFWALCVLLFLLGSAVGGSLPTDGTLLLEHMPKDKQYLVTALSIFFSIGSVVSALVGLIVMPGRSCLPNQSCDPSTDNRGWQYMLVTLGLITLSLFLARILFFRLHESPRYLVQAGRHQEALENLQLISRFNGSELPLELDDVDDRHPPQPEVNGSTTSGERVPFLPSSNVSETPTRPVTAVADGNATSTPVEPSGDQGLSRTLLIRHALAYTMFNVFFPKLLETSSSREETSRSLEDNLSDVVIYTLGGCPGAILGAYLVESSLGRKGSLVGMTILTAICCFLFVNVSGPFLIRASSLGISLCSTAMYAILYGWTPEIFSTGVRGTACGIATALSRIGGMIAPLVGGVLLVVNRAFPVYASILVYMFGAGCVLFLHETPGH
ncbi:hypothetical protein M404DRAFT_170644 [Pisolithus tinctorius Marx 270]|uniref:Major facilitator superfamily (MFS) profile domain-containing protein n=1 Tax=Pisolithus tinctorius Marx 270 TaxID=870435 RepID=A0A0C3MXK5_PISTI|nr:hypothetical protein M404DRAFT_170644 [Pisolithus tinctorius Marx 270]